MCVGVIQRVNKIKILFLNYYNFKKMGYVPGTDNLYKVLYTLNSNQHLNIFSNSSIDQNNHFSNRSKLTISLSFPTIEIHVSSLEKCILITSFFFFLSFLIICATNIFSYSFRYKFIKNKSSFTTT